MKPEKTCCACGRPMEYRKKWASNWDEVKYCSKACRSRGVPERLMAEIVNLLNIQESGKTICPGDVLHEEDKTDKQKVERVRSAARLLAHAGEITIQQNGKAVSPADFKGPIRLSKS